MECTAVQELFWAAQAAVTTASPVDSLRAGIGLVPGPNTQLFSPFFFVDVILALAPPGASSTVT